MADSSVSLLLILILVTQCPCLSRDVPARTELCQRYNIECHSNQEANNNISEGLPERSHKKQNNYCGMYEPHFLYFCIGGNPGSNRQDIDKFCHTFRKLCGVQGGQQTDSSSLTEQVAFSPEKCDQYGAMAVTMCSGREKGNLRQLCELYNQICKPGTRNVALRGGPGNPALERLQLCKQYSPLIKLACAGEDRGQAAKFCNLYKTFCFGLTDPRENYRGALSEFPVASDLSGQATSASVALNSVSAKRREDAQPHDLPTATGSSESGPLIVTPEGVGLGSLSPEHLAHLCTQYATLVKSKCNGKEQGQLRKVCEMFKTYCSHVKVSGVHFPERSVEAPAVTNLYPAPSGHISMTSPADGKVLCKQYEQMAAELCTGKEEGKLRQACNVYRANCLSSAHAPSAEQHPATTISGTSPAGFGATGFLPLMSRILPHHLLYCKRFLMSFAKFCLRRPPTDALFFCLAYGERCFPGVFNAARMAASSRQPIWAAYGAPGSWDIPLLCLNFKDISERYCTGYEPEFIREYCNVYRILCLV
ncbi:hypothetical protein M514_01977 [Trichuris suis]|uniref:Uncharacterized protein n=1 Tax=Trichuris suis TaxID=68888 RepID=A0A085NJG6_9BILA|nr:hypothetical protein M514_01977 [Trichuris suis]